MNPLLKSPDVGTRGHSDRTGRSSLNVCLRPCGTDWPPGERMRDEGPCSRPLFPMPMTFIFEIPLPTSSLNSVLYLDVVNFDNGVTSSRIRVRINFETTLRGLADYIGVHNRSHFTSDGFCGDVY